MIKTDYFVLCEATTEDKKGRVSLINIFDSVIATKIPFKSDKFSVAFSLEMPIINIDNGLNVSIEFVDIDEKAIFKATGEAEKLPTLPNRNGVAKFSSALDIKNGINFKQHGRYKYRLYINDNLVSENHLRVLAKKANKIEV